MSVPGLGECKCIMCSTQPDLKVSNHPTKDKPDAINPAHYRSHPSGVETITITEHMNFCMGNAIKYIMRAGLKGDAIEDLKKARWYIDREITRRKAELAKL